MKTFLTCLVLLLGMSALAQDAPVRKAGPGTPDNKPAEGPSKTKVQRPAAVSSITPEALVNFSFYAPQIQQLVRDALALTKLNLRYTFGSSDPKAGGMDCSGTLYHLLNGVGLKGVPRQSDEMCAWVQNATLLHRTPNADSLTHPEFAALQPGDLLFWSGTYEPEMRSIPVTHVMLYLGKLKKGGHVTFGSSDGRTFQGEQRNGVSVFDLSVPYSGSKTRIYGYGLIPGVGRLQVKPSAPPLISAAGAPVKPPAVNSAKPGEQEQIQRAVIASPPSISKADMPQKAKTAPPQKSTAPKSKSSAGKKTMP